MSNEFIHIDPGDILTKAEFELITGHQFNSQATGDILYASTSTQLSRLGIGSNTNVLEITGGVPAWVASSGTGSVARVTSPTFVTPALGTPSALVGTNISGTASSLTAGTVTTNANLTGHVTSSGNAAVLGSFTSAQLATALTNETGSGLAVFGTSPTLVTPALGTPSALVGTNISGTAASLTAGAATALASARTIGGTSFDGTANIAVALSATTTALATARTIGGTSFDGTGNISITTNANLTGVVTSSGNATAIADKAIGIAKLADGTDGELITWDSSGVIAAVAVGSADQVLTSNGSGAAPTFQAASGGATVYAGSFTKNTADATGTQAIECVGFEPKAVIFFMNVSGQDEMSFGLADDTNSGMVADQNGQQACDYYSTTGRVIQAIQSSNVEYNGALNSMDSDGFTIGWTKYGAKSGTMLVNFLAIR